MRIWTIVLMCGAVAFAACGGCGDPDPAPDAAINNVADDAANNRTDAADMPASDMVVPGDMPPARGRVVIDLAPYADGNLFDDGQPVRVFQSTDEAELVPGPVASGRAGDWVLQNGAARFVVEGEDRSMSPCPYGGHIIDGTATNVENDGDMIGEICLLVNAGSTMIPESFEVLSDGSDGVGILAVTGPLGINDWINFNTMAADLGFGGIGELRIGPNRVPTITATVYYIIRAGERGIRSVIALRNDGSAQQDLFIGSLMGGGGDGSYWNPLSSKRGYGTTGISLDTLVGEPMPFVGYGGNNKSFWAYVPKPNPAFDQHDLPIGGVYLAISNIVVNGLDIPNILQVMIATEAQIPTHPDLTHLQPAETVVKEHWTYVGNSAAMILDQAYPTVLGVQTGTIEGTVVDENGDPEIGAIVTALDTKGQPMSHTRSVDPGTFSLSVPPGNYTVSARVGNLVASALATVGPGTTVSDVQLPLPAPATITVNVTDPAGAPVPGRVTVICDPAPCPGKPTQAEVDTVTDGLPAQWAGVYFADIATGEAVFQLPAGQYRVVVSRGMAWSVWPTDGVPDRGFPITVAANERPTIDAEIAQVVDMTGLLATDMHVHTISSHDSSTPHTARIAGFVADGIDVAVSTDHDIIADYGPAVTWLGAEQHIATVVGLEITTSDLGHYNAFPLAYDAAHKRGGALDWANGPDLALLPSEMFAWFDAHPGEQVVQVNHADSLGLIKSTLGDPLRGISLADPATMRLPASAPDPVTGDTGLWTDDFTAYEVANGNDLPQYWALFRWWLTMIGRGFAPTGTAVSDTHRRWSDVGTTPRSLVTVPAGTDTPSTFSESAFVTAVNAGKVIGTNGPTLRVVIQNPGIGQASYGEVVDGADGEVNAAVSIQMPEWMRIDTIDVYTNLDTVITEPGVPNEDPVVPSMSVPVTFDPADFVDVATGTSVHRRIEKTVNIPLTITEDAYFVFIVRGVATSNMVPVLREVGTRPFAFTNPIFVDFDGNGYDNPPLAAAARTLAPRPSVLPGPRDVTPTAAQIMMSFESRTCSEFDHAH